MLEYSIDVENRSTWILTTQNATARAMPFYLTEIGRFYASAGYYTKRSDKAGYYLVYTHSGCGRMHLPTGEYDLPTGTAMLLPCTPLHNYHTLGDSWQHSWMHLDGGGVAALAGVLGSEPVQLAEPQEFVAQFGNLLTLADQIDVVAVARTSNAISALLTAMVEAHLAADSLKNVAQHAGIEAALHFIEKNYRDPISIDDITRNVNISKFHFVRLFRKHMGTTPYNYLLHYRVGQSKQLLCTTDAPISDIAQHVGFPSQSNYISQFRRLTGVTPAQFRKNNLLSFWKKRK